MITAIILFLTALISVLGLNNKDIINRLSLYPYRMVKNGEWYRIITHGFVHADYTHLIVNLIVLWSFGRSLDMMLNVQNAVGMLPNHILMFCIIYFGGMIVSSIYDIIKRKNNLYYTSIGASGAVSAIVFAMIFFSPLKSVWLLGILPIPGILFGILYLGYEYYMASRNNDNINHYAHLFGAVFGFALPMAINPKLFQIFLSGFNF